MYMRFACGFIVIILASCSGTVKKDHQATNQNKESAPSYFKVDTATAGVLTGKVQYAGRKPPRQAIDMSSDPACMEAHAGKAYEQSVDVNPNGALGNVFVYVKSGLEGKKFAVPASPVTIDQKGCWFQPHVMGIQTGQELRVINSDPVTHNIHPLAQVNREWNHSQGPGDAPLARKFTKPEVMIRVKCNIHGWMRAYIGVQDHPYFAVTGSDGSFKIPNLPPGDYVIEAWQETLGSQDQKVTVTPAGKVDANFHFKGE